VNTLIVDLVQPTTEVARVIGAVANGDLAQTMALEIDGGKITAIYVTRNPDKLGHLDSSSGA
jgi:hypothetical protein